MTPPRSKSPTNVDQRFPFLKNPALVAAVFRKQPTRTQALGYVRLRAWLLVSVVERRVRAHPAALSRSQQGHLARPTGYEILKRAGESRCSG